MQVELSTDIILPRLKEIYFKAKAIPRSYKTPLDEIQNLSDIQANAYALVKLVEYQMEHKVKECEDIFREANDVKLESSGKWIKEDL